MNNELLTVKVLRPMAQGNEKDKGGRPTLYTPETVDRLLAGLADGLNKEQSCKAAGIGVSTLSDWLERHPELEPQLAEAREQARQKALSGIKAAGEGGDWRAWESFLKHSFPADYRQGSNIKVEATANASSGVVLSEQERARLIELRGRLLSEQAAVTTLPADKSEKASLPKPKAGHPVEDVEAARAVEPEPDPAIEERYRLLEATKGQFNTEPPWTVRPTPVDEELGSTYEGR
jgi:hypothetical protein